MRTKLFELTLVLLVTFAFNAVAITRYVDLNSPNPTLPYTDWATAATNIQDAIGISVSGDIVLVTNGVYWTRGAAPSGRISINSAITVQSVNGPEYTAIQGTNWPSDLRCASVTGGGRLFGFTLTRGRADYGGGVYLAMAGSVVSNCVIIGNKATYGGGCAFAGSPVNGITSGAVVDCVIKSNTATYGGGAYSNLLTRCILLGNGGPEINVTIRGGGAFACVMNNCLIVSNVANYSAGAHGCAIQNSTIVGNYATYFGAAGVDDSRLANSVVFDNRNFRGDVFNFGSQPMTNCCTWPMPTGRDNTTNAPLFVDEASDNYRLQPNSPCINAGTIISGTSLVDIDGNPRIVGGTVDVGAYEFQSPASVLSYAWAQQNGLATDGSADFTDADGDGANNWQEWRADTIPTNAVSALRLVSATNSPSGAVVTWQSVSTRNYWLERATNLGVASPFQTIATNIAGKAGTKNYTDTTATGGGPYLYRIGVK